MSYKLYRGVSKEKYSTDGGVIKAYKLGPFYKEFNLNDGHVLDEGLTIDSSKNNAVILHQKDSKKFPTSGISFTPHKERAKYYATNNDQKDGLIFCIDRRLLTKNNTEEFIVAKYTDTPHIPEDDEVILHVKDDKDLPQELIKEIVESVVD
jgi:hypothetical protein